MPRYAEHRLQFGDGYYSERSPDTLPEAAMSFGSQDLTITKSGSVEKRMGFNKAITNQNSTYTETLGLGAFFRPSQTRALVRIARNTTTNDVRFEYNTSDFPTTVSNWSFGTSLGTVVNNERYCQFTNFNQALYVALPDVAALKYITNSGTFTLNDVTTTGTARTFNKPSGVEVWYDRVWCYLDETIEDGAFLLYTDTAGTAIDLDKNFEEIVGSGPITGLKRLDRHLIVFNQSEIFRLSGGADVDNIRIDKISSDTGCVSPRSIVEVEGWIYFYDRKGFYRTDGRDVQYISKQIENYAQNLTGGLLNRVAAVHNRNESHVTWFVPYSGDASMVWGGAWGTGWSGNSKQALAYDYSNQRWCAPFTNQDFQCATTYFNSIGTGTTSAEVIITGSITSADIFLWWDGDNDDGGQTNAILVSKPQDFGDPAAIKIVRKVYTHVGEMGQIAVTGGGPWSTGLYGSTPWPGSISDTNVPLRLNVHDAYGTLSAADDTVNQTLSSGSRDFPQYSITRHTVGTQGHYIQFEVRDYDDGNAPGGPWSLSGLTVLYSMKGRRS